MTSPIRVYIHATIKNEKIAQANNENSLAVITFHYNRPNGMASYQFASDGQWSNFVRHLHNERDYSGDVTFEYYTYNYSHTMTAMRMIGSTQTNIQKVCESGNLLANLQAAYPYDESLPERIESRPLERIYWMMRMANIEDPMGITTEDVRQGILTRAYSPASDWDARKIDNLTVTLPADGALGKAPRLVTLQGESDGGSGSSGTPTSTPRSIVDADVYMDDSHWVSQFVKDGFYTKNELMRADIVDRPIFFFDTETTSLGDNAQIIQMGLVTIDGVEFLTNVKPTREAKIAPKAFEKHGIKMDVLQKAPTFPKAWTSMRTFIREQSLRMDKGGVPLLVAYNVAFDFKKVLFDMGRHGIVDPTDAPAMFSKSDDRAIICHFADMYERGGRGSNTLGAIYLLVTQQSPRDDAHNALADSHMLRDVYQKMRLHNQYSKEYFIKLAPGDIRIEYAQFGKRH
jgi:DNA polymerase III epsilon subunit-like protein